MIEIEKARLVRERIDQASKYFQSNESALSSNGQEIEWMDLEEFPEWCNWDKQRLHRLVLIAGTVFVLPSVRLWIKSKQIQKIQSLIGKNVYDFLIKYTYKEIEPSQHAFIEEIETTLTLTGSAVILSSVEPKLVPWLQKMVPKTNYKLKKYLATELLNHALYVIKHTNETSRLNESNL